METTPTGSNLSPEAAFEVEPRLSFDVLCQNPTMYRTLLMILLKSLPYTHSVQDVLGAQAENLVSFCLNPDYLDEHDEQLTPAMDRALEDGALLASDSQEALYALTRANTTGLHKEIEETEKVRRRRLLIWVDFLDELLLRQQSQFPQDSGNNGNTHAA